MKASALRQSEIFSACTVAESFIANYAENGVNQVVGFTYNQ
jgi:hypothetical protein